MVNIKKNSNTVIISPSGDGGEAPRSVSAQTGTNHQSPITNHQPDHFGIMAPRSKSLFVMRGFQGTPRPPKDYPGKQAPTTPLLFQNTGTNIAFWGVNNLFPQDLLTDIYATPALRAGLDWAVRALYAGGIIYGEANYDDKGNEIIIPAKDPNIKKLFRSIKIERYLAESISDYCFFGKVFPQIILSRDRSLIANLNRQRSAWCRQQKQNPESGLSEGVYINANWGKGPANEASSALVPVLDDFFDPAERLRLEEKGYIYMMPFGLPMMDETYYPIVPWNTIRQSQWLNHLNSIPTFKNALMQNQTTIKYLVEVPSYYWTYKYPDWDSYTAEKKVKLMQEEIDTFDAMMSGPDKAGKSVFTTAHYDQIKGELHPGWKISAIDDKIKDGIYIEDGQEGTTMVLLALGINPSLLGMNPGKGMASGSGADERVAFNDHISTRTIDVHQLLEPVRFVAEYNGLPDYEYRFRVPLIMTLDKGKQVQQQTS